MTGDTRHQPFDIDVEIAVLGSLLKANRLIDQVAADLEARCFYDPFHQRLYDMVLYLAGEGESVTPLIIQSVMKTDPGFTEVGGLEYLRALVSASPAIPNMRELTGILRELAFRRDLIRVGEELALAALESPHDAPAQRLADEATESLLQAGRVTAKPILTPYEIAMQSMRDLEAVKQGKLIPGIKTGIEKLDKEIGVLRGGDLITFLGKSGMGKAQPLKTPVLKADGSWCAISDLRIGDALASVDGAPSRVTGIFHRGVLDVARITFSDGRATTACVEHLWEVFNSTIWKSSAVKTTEEIGRYLAMPSYRNRLAIPKVSGDFGHIDTLPLHPYLLGCLLGDGGFTNTGVRLTSADKELVSRVRSCLPPETEIIPVSGSYAYSIKAAPGYFKGKFGAEKGGNAVTAALREMGLQGLGSADKFIPQEYLAASRGQRLELLRGLLDTDGWAEKHGTIRFCSTSLRLAEQVMFLTRSLGGAASIAERQTSFTHKGERLLGKKSYVCKIRHEAGETLFALSRKADRARRTRNASVGVNFQSIVPAGREECVCISVSHPRQLYVTEDFIVTHNSALMGTIALNVARQGIPVLFFSLEMSASQLVERMVCDLDFDTAEKPMWYSRVRNGRLSDDEFERFMLTSQRLQNIPLEICDEDGLTIAQISQRARAFKAKHGKNDDGTEKIGLILTDYFQIVDPTDDRDNRERQVAKIARGAKSLAKRLNWPVGAGSQMNENDEGRAKEERRPRASDARESKAIMNESDLMLAPYRAAVAVENAKPLGAVPGDASWIAWNNSYREVRHQFDLLCLKNRHGRRFDLHLYCEMGSSAIRDREPAKARSQITPEEEIAADLLGGL